MMKSPKESQPNKIPEIEVDAGTLTVFAVVVPGQAAVWYDGEVLLGGGIIDRL
jgi:tRNA U34 2-thiouridine synthase MnmA/TrmU